MAAPGGEAGPDARAGADWALHWVAVESAGRPRARQRPRNVRAPQGRVVANSHPGRPAGQCHRKQTAAQCGKGEKVG